MKRSFAAALLVAGLLAAPVAALARDGRDGHAAPPRAPSHGYVHPSAPRYGGGHRPVYQYRQHAFVGPRFIGPSYAVAAQPVWIEPTWSWDGWQWVWVPGYWTW